MDPKINYICPSCGRTFSKKSNLDRHVNNIHVDKLLQKVFTCYHCNASRSNKSNLIRHILKCPKRNLNPPSQSRKLVVCSICGYKNTRNSLLDHFSQQHNIDIVIESLEFNSFAEFEAWRDMIERKTISRYVICNSSKTKSKTIYYYRCHRDGHFKSRGKNMRRLKNIGSNKMNSHCPSRLDVTFMDESGGLHVKFVKNHVGHEMELERIPLKKTEKDILATKLAQKVPFDEVISTIKDTATKEKLDRLHLLTRKDLFNIKKQYNLNINQTSSTSLETWIEEMNVKTDKLIKFYKAHGEEMKEYVELKRDDFLLIIMNQMQLEILKMYGNNCICVDCISGSAAYHPYKLMSIMVIDEAQYQQGFSCFFAIYNRHDITIFNIIFSVLRTILETSLTPTVLLSDQSEIIYEAWSNVMGPVNYHLYNTWHVWKTWKNEIANKVKNLEKHSFICSSLRNLMEEEFEFTFETLLKNFIVDMASDQDLVDFLKYFMETAYSKTKSWACSYRKQVGLDVNLLFERMHLTLEYIYSQGKRLDKTISNIVTFVQEKLQERFIFSDEDKHSSKLNELKKRHKTMESIKKNFTIEYKLDRWIISTPNQKKIYTIKRCNTYCRCNLKCTDCNICVHNYVCSCSDSLLKWNMCKHIHILYQQSLWVQDSYQENIEQNENKYSEDFSYNIDHVDHTESVVDNSESIIDNSDSLMDCGTNDSETDVKANAVDSISAKVEQEQSYEENNVVDSKARLLQMFSSILKEITTNEELVIAENAISSIQASLTAVRSASVFVDASNTNLGNGKVSEENFVPLEDKV